MKKFIIIALVACGLLALGGWVIGVYTDTRNDGIHRELALTADYKGMMAEYGQARASVMDQLGIARDKRDAMDTILKNAIEGRQYGGGGTNVNRGALMLAVKEAYPDLGGLNIYDRLIDSVQQMRTRFAQLQVNFSAKVQAYNEWRTTGSFLKPMIVSMVGFPSSSLTVTVGNTTVRGQDALDKMSVVIIAADSQRIFNNGTDEQLDLHEQKR